MTLPPSDEMKARRSKFGVFVKKRRGELNLSLRAFCRRHDIDPSNWPYCDEIYR